MSGNQQEKALERRDFPRLKASFRVRFGVCGGHGGNVPGFTSDVSLGGICFQSPDSNAKVGDHLAVEISVPGYETPLYFLGQVVRVREDPAGKEIAVRFDWLGKSEQYREMLAALLEAHQ